MRPILAFLALCLAAAVPMRGEAKNPVPEGGYMLVDPILTGVKLGMTVPIFIHMDSHGDRLDFTFYTSYRPDAQFCEVSGKCSRAVTALSLTVTEERSRIKVLDSRTDTSEPIDHDTLDGPFILVPTFKFIDGSAVSVSEQGHLPGTVILTRPAGFSARFIPSGKAGVDEAIAFAKIYEMPLYKFDYCVIRQIAEIAATHDRSPAQEDILRAARHAARLEALDAESGPVAAGAEPGTEAWLAPRRRTMLRLAMIFDEPEDTGAPEERVRALLEASPMQKALGAHFDTVYGEVIAGYEDEILAARAYNRSVATARKALPEDAFRQRLCESVIPDAP